jgi:hypothetical protein
MTMATENSEITLKDHSSNVVYLQTAGLTPELQKGMVEYYNHKLDNREDIIHHDDIAKIAFYKTIEYGLLSIFLYNVETGHFLFNEGCFHHQVSSLMKNYLHRLNENNKIETYPVFIEERLFDLELRLIMNDSTKHVFGIIVQEMQIQTDIANYLEKLFSRYYFIDSRLYTSLYEYNCLPELNRILRVAASRVQKNKQKLHYVLIEIESLNKYIKVAGDYLVNEIIKNVQETISSMIQDIGRCFILNSRQYLITVENIDEKTIKEKFGHAHFRIKNLLLVYRMNYYEVTDFENGYTIENVWPNLLIK